MAKTQQRAEQHAFKAGETVWIPAKLLAFCPQVKEGHARFQVIDENAVGQPAEIVCSTSAVSPITSGKYK